MGATKLLRTQRRWTSWCNSGHHFGFANTFAEYTLGALVHSEVFRCVKLYAELHSLHLAIVPGY